MLFRFLPLLLLLLPLLLASVDAMSKKNSKPVLSDCEKSCGNVLTPDQKTKLCAAATGPGPCACAVAGKSLHLHGDDLVKLCQAAASTSPVECMRQLSASDRKKHGMQVGYVQRRLCSCDVLQVIAPDVATP